MAVFPTVTQLISVGAGAQTQAVQPLSTVLRFCFIEMKSQGDGQYGASLDKIYIILIMKTLKTDIAKNWDMTTLGRRREGKLRAPLKRRLCQKAESLLPWEEIDSNYD